MKLWKKKKRFKSMRIRIFLVLFALLGTWLGPKTYNIMCAEKSWQEFAKYFAMTHTEADTSPDNASTEGKPAADLKRADIFELGGMEAGYSRIVEDIENYEAGFDNLNSAGEKALRAEKYKVLSRDLDAIMRRLEKRAIVEPIDSERMTCCDPELNELILLVSEIDQSLDTSSELLGELGIEISKQRKDLYKTTQEFTKKLIAMQEYVDSRASSSKDLPMLSGSTEFKDLKAARERFNSARIELVGGLFKISKKANTTFTFQKRLLWSAAAMYGLVALCFAFWYVKSLIAVTGALHRISKVTPDRTKSLVDELTSTPFLSIKTLGGQASALVEAKTRQFELFTAQKHRESEIAGAVAHEYGNNIMVIQGLLITAIEALESGENGETLKYQLKALSACDDAKAIVAPLRESGQTVRTKMVTGISLERVLQEERSKLAAEDDQHIEVNLHPECVGVLVDESDFLSIIRNLLMNAQESNAKVNSSAISLSTHPLERLDSEIVMELLGKTEEGAEFICIEVGDQGIGISEEIGNQVFNLGYSTKSEQERKMQPGAKGCGLHIVWNKVKENGGVIDFVRNASGGVTFRVFLPRATKYEIELPTRPSDLSKVSMVGGEILLVEDNFQVREVVELMLKARGYSAFAVPNAEAALLQLKMREGKNPFLAIISDINLGVDCMSGFDLVKELRAIQCMVPVLLITAYHSDELSRDLDPEEYNYAVLEKPFTPMELYAMLKLIVEFDEEVDGEVDGEVDVDDVGGGGGVLEEVV